MVVGVLQVELHVPKAQSLKDKRAVVKSLREQLRGRFNVAVAEVHANDTWQRATLGVSAVGSDRAYTEGLLNQVVEWLRETRLADLVRVEQEYL